METCLYFKNGLCEKANKAVEILDTEYDIACLCIEHDIIRVLEKCKDFSPDIYSDDFRNQVLERIAEIKHEMTPKAIREKKSNPLADISADIKTDSQQIGNLIVLLQYHNFVVLPKVVRMQIYDLMKDLRLPLDKNMKMDRNKVFKQKLKKKVLTGN